MFIKNILIYKTSSMNSSWCWCLEFCLNTSANSVWLCVPYIPQPPDSSTVVTGAVGTTAIELRMELLALTSSSSMISPVSAATVPSDVDVVEVAGIGPEDVAADEAAADATEVAALDMTAAVPTANISAVLDMPLSFSEAAVLDVPADVVTVETTAPVALYGPPMEKNKKVKFCITSSVFVLLGWSTWYNSV